VFAYGQTGSGKSYSIEGYEEKGILQMCLEDIFLRRKPENNKKGLVTSVRITYLEIYN
jgi:kinesin family protein 1